MTAEEQLQQLKEQEASFAARMLAAVQACDPQAIADLEYERLARPAALATAQRLVIGEKLAAIARELAELEPKMNEQKRVLLQVQEVAAQANAAAKEEQNRYRQLASRQDTLVYNRRTLQWKLQELEAEASGAAERMRAPVVRSIPHAHGT